MAEFEFKPDNRSFLTKLGEVARVTATATLCVLDNTNKTLVVTNKVLEQAIDVVDHACDSLTESLVIEQVPKLLLMTSDLVGRQRS